jgi:hypothetical protein
MDNGDEEQEGQYGEFLGTSLGLEVNIQAALMTFFWMSYFFAHGIPNITPT